MEHLLWTVKAPRPGMTGTDWGGAMPSRQKGKWQASVCLSGSGDGKAFYIPFHQLFPEASSQHQRARPGANSRELCRLWAQVRPRRGAGWRAPCCTPSRPAGWSRSPAGLAPAPLRNSRGPGERNGSATSCRGRRLCGLEGRLTTFIAGEIICTLSKHFYTIRKEWKFGVMG